MSARMASRTSRNLATNRTEYTVSISFASSRPIRGRGYSIILNLLLLRFPVQRGRADLQVSERPLKVKLECKCGTRHCAPGDLGCLRFRRIKRGKYPDFLTVD